jgi:hypothetical protein
MRTRFVLVEKPGSDWAKIGSDDGPRFTHDVAGLFFCGDGGAFPRRDYRRAIYSLDEALVEPSAIGLFHRLLGFLDADSVSLQCNDAAERRKTAARHLGFGTP